MTIPSEKSTNWGHSHGQSWMDAASEPGSSCRASFGGDLFLSYRVFPKFPRGRHPHAWFGLLARDFRRNNITKASPNPGFCVSLVLDFTVTHHSRSQGLLWGSSCLIPLPWGSGREMGTPKAPGF